jgi:acyl-CoA reductase-like NAD-dependent aldehyde dehydrogenase
MADATPPSRLVCKAGTSWEDLYARCVTLAPEAFDTDRVRNLWGGEWRRSGDPDTTVSPVDGRPIVGPPMLEADQAAEAVRAAAVQHGEWSKVGLDERRRRVRETLELMDRHRDLLALLLVWEIGKPLGQAETSVDRTISGVGWYLDHIAGMLEGRRPLKGPVSNIASWNYPLSVLVHALLVQVLAGNAVIAKTPTDGGLCALTLSLAFACRSGLPVNLVGGSGSTLAPALVRSPEIAAVSFVGGRDAGGRIAADIGQSDKRLMLEQEGVNAWGIWEFSDWDGLAEHLRAGFAYAKQRCTAYPRYVVQRSLFDRFVPVYLSVMESLTFGHPLAVEHPDDPAPDLDFGPLINAGKAAELADALGEGLEGGGIPLVRRPLASGRFIEGQDTSAYMAPAAILAPPTSWSLYHAEPFGPLDSVVVVDSEAELLAAMNVSNGALVASLACDDTDLAEKLSAELNAFKIGINKPRSRGDKDEVFGGTGASWRGAFVGGELLVQAVTEGPPGERLFGNFPDYQLYPET